LIIAAPSESAASATRAFCVSIDSGVFQFCGQFAEDGKQAGQFLLRGTAKAPGRVDSAPTIDDIRSFFLKTQCLGRGRLGVKEPPAVGKGIRSDV
jgi:hypothetical protein